MWHFQVENGCKIWTISHYSFNVFPLSILRLFWTNISCHHCLYLWYSEKTYFLSPLSLCFSISDTQRRHITIVSISDTQGRQIFPVTIVSISDTRRRQILTAWKLFLDFDKKISLQYCRPFWKCKILYTISIVHCERLTVLLLSIPAGYFKYTANM